MHILVARISCAESGETTTSLRERISKNLMMVLAFLESLKVLPTVYRVKAFTDKDGRVST